MIRNRRNKHCQFLVIETNNGSLYVALHGPLSMLTDGLSAVARDALLPYQPMHPVSKYLSSFAVNAYICTHICTHVVCIHIHTHIYIYMYINGNTYIYIYIDMCMYIHTYGSFQFVTVRLFGNKGDGRVLLLIATRN